MNPLISEITIKIIKNVDSIYKIVQYNKYITLYTLMNTKNGRREEKSGKHKEMQTKSDV